MKAMVIQKIMKVTENSRPVREVDMSVPSPETGEILLKVRACGVCHTELDEIEGRTPPSSLPVIPGHQVIGTVVEAGEKSQRFQIGDRVGAAWIYSSCGRCEYCRSGDDNLCAQFRATGRDAHGGYAEYMTVPESSAYPIPEVFSDREASPLLCAGAIGYRSLRLTGLDKTGRLGLTGFGASAHLVLKLVTALYPDMQVYVFARNPGEREFASELGAVWTGDTMDSSPEKLHAVIDTTPVWKPVVEALENLLPGGRLVINAIRKEDMDREYLLKLDYAKHLWMEKEIKSVANVARRDVEEFLKAAAKVPLRPETSAYALEDAGRALIELKTQKIRGAKVLVMD